MKKEEAEKEVMDILGEYKDVMESYLAIPVLVGVKTDNEKFAGALYTTEKRYKWELAITSVKTSPRFST